MAHILLVEDETNISNIIRVHLEEQGHQVTQFFRGNDAIHYFTEQEPQLVILDIMLPDLAAHFNAIQIRLHSICPILMLTARSEEIDRVMGLDAGADDYLTKPFSMHELKARVRAQLRRADMASGKAQNHAKEKIISVANLTMDIEGYETTLSNQRIDLTTKEFEILHLLLSNPGRVFSRIYLLEQIWGYAPEASDRTVDTHIYRLRQKLGINGEISQRIVAVRGIGYKFER
jgi:DNA-binding response OmpR family regulator